MRWRKMGRIFVPDNNFGWMLSHAQVPTVLDMGHFLRIYFSTRTSPTESKIAVMDVDAQNPSKILEIHSGSLLDCGAPGTFDEHGLMPSSVLKDSDNKIRLYYSGWSRRTTVPYSNLTGLALSEDGINFRKIGGGPILSTNYLEPYSATSPFVYSFNGAYVAFYCSGNDWLKIDGKYEHTYDIKSAHSEDGIHWVQNGKTCFSKTHPREAVTRPTVLSLHGNYHMWFCYRGSLDFRDGAESYRIGYAYSKDLEGWERRDADAGIYLGPDEWDSSMLAYPYVLETIYGIYMFYNGNGFGKSGFGYAILEDYK